MSGSHVADGRHPVQQVGSHGATVKKTNEPDQWQKKTEFDTIK